MKGKFLQVLFFLGIGLWAINTRAQDLKESLNSFRELKTFNGIEVLVIPSTTNSIEISGHSKDDVKFKVVEDRLEIRLSLDNLWSKDNTTIKVYGKNIETIDANEGSQIRVQGDIKASHAVFRAQEGASIVSNVTADHVNSKAISGGKIELSGKAEQQEVEANTGGQFYGRGLRTKETTASVGTAGRAEIYATNYVKATAKLGGVIEVNGNPDKVDTKTSLGGKIL